MTYLFMIQQFFDDPLKPSSIHHPSMIHFGQPALSIKEANPTTKLSGFGKGRFDLIDSATGLMAGSFTFYVKASPSIVDSVSFAQRDRSRRTDSGAQTEGVVG
jgi:hypothetical protein